MILPEEEAKPHTNRVKGVVHGKAHCAGIQENTVRQTVLSRLPLKSSKPCGEDSWEGRKGAASAGTAMGSTASRPDGAQGRNPSVRGRAGGEGSARECVCSSVRGSHLHYQQARYRADLCCQGRGVTLPTERTHGQPRHPPGKQT